MEHIAPLEIRYIKLGPGGAWAKHCLQAGEMHFGYASIPHDIAHKGDWDAVMQIFTEREGRSPGKAKDSAREIRDFYELGAECLWITFADGHLWWAFANPCVEWLGETDKSKGPRMRKTITPWRKVTIKGQPLRVDHLSTRLTQVAAYRQTICRVKQEDYLLRRINGLEEPVVRRARDARTTLTVIAAEMIAGLHWAEFENLVDLIFARSGWQRISGVGGTLVDVDLVLEQPATGETAFVQVKSKAAQPVLDDYIDRFQRSGTHDRLFFVCHSPQGTLSAKSADPIHIWEGDTLANNAVKAGLFDWLIERSI